MMESGMKRPLMEAFQYRGCPVCRHLDKDEYDFMCHFQGKAFKEEKVRQDLVSSNGFCNFHFHEMARLTSPLVNAVLTKELIDRGIKEIERGFFGGVECPACEYLGQREGLYLQEITSLLGDTYVQQLYKETDGLCRIHLQRVLNLLGGNEFGQFFLQSESSHLRNLGKELQTFIEKGGRTSREIGKEKNSWWVAIQKWVGRKGLREFL